MQFQEFRRSKEETLTRRKIQFLFHAASGKVGDFEAKFS